MENNSAKSKRKISKAGLFGIIGAGLLLASVGGVFAANSITINSGSDVEFGQGVTATSTCDAGLTTEITQEYNATDNKFYATTVVVGGINDFDCDGKNLHVSLVDASSTICDVDGTHTSGANQDSFAITDGGTTGTNDVITKTVTISANCDATTIVRVALTTS